MLSKSPGGPNEELNGQVKSKDRWGWEAESINRRRRQSNKRRWRGEHQGPATQPPQQSQSKKGSKLYRRKKNPEGKGRWINLS